MQPVQIDDAYDCVDLEAIEVDPRRAPFELEIAVSEAEGELEVRFEARCAPDASDCLDRDAGTSPWVLQDTVRVVRADCGAVHDLILTRAEEALRSIVPAHIEGQDRHRSSRVEAVASTSVGPAPLTARGAVGLRWSGTDRVGPTLLVRADAGATRLHRVQTLCRPACETVNTVGSTGVQAGAGVRYAPAGLPEVEARALVGPGVLWGEGFLVSHWAVVPLLDVEVVGRMAVGGGTWEVGVQAEPLPIRVIASGWPAERLPPVRGFLGLSFRL